MNKPESSLTRDATPLRALAEKLFAELTKGTQSGAGITRECYGVGETAALALFRETALAHGLKCTNDGAANLIVALPDDDLNKPALLVGSHADSVPHGGNYDGAAGIVAGLLCLIRLREERCALPHPVRLLAMRGEESAYYGRANIGSRALFGLLTPNDLDARRQGGGPTLREALCDSQADIDAIASGRPLLEPNFASAYLELHIEQGPAMLARGLATAVVSGIRGNLRHRRIVCRGEAGHSGTVPRWLRRDALFAVSDLIMRLDDHWSRLLERGIDLVMTVGICSTDSELQAVSRIPGEVYFSFEARSQSYDTLEGFYELFRSECRAVSDQRHVGFELDERVYTEPAIMDERITTRLKALSQELGLSSEVIPSGAGHDAAVFANNGIPTGMIFVRNRNGSHNPDEDMTLDDFMRGFELLHAFICSGAIA